MKNSHIIRLIVAIILITSYSPNAICQVKPAQTPVKAAQIKEVTLKDLPTTQKILDEGITIKAEAGNWYMVNMEAAAQKGGATPLNVPKVNGWGKIKVEKGGKMYLTDVNMNFKMNIPIVEKGQTSMVASGVQVTGISKEDFQMDGNKVSKFGLLEQDGGFNLPWIVKIKFDALPGQEYLACIQTWGLMGKEVLPNKENYADFGGLVGIKPLKATKSSEKTLDVSKLNPIRTKGKDDSQVRVGNYNGPIEVHIHLRSWHKQRTTKSAPSPYKDSVVNNMDAMVAAIKAVYNPKK